MAVPRFRARVVEVEAIQWSGTNTTELAAFAGDRFTATNAADRSSAPNSNATFQETDYKAPFDLVVGDWVVRGEGGWFGVLDDEEFTNRYEPLAAAGAVPPAHTGADVIDLGWNGEPPEARLHLTVNADMPTTERAQLVADLRAAIALIIPVRDMPAAGAVAAPADTNLRGLLVRSLRDPLGEGPWAVIVEHQADAVLAVLPARTDRAAEWRAAAEVAAQWPSDCQNCAVELELAAELRRRAAEWRAAEVSP
ncbi:hypothetical protein [Streptomyces sp. NPDC050738]|uniref:hypothetical protein n=1 Tax=Streptomyces sp. NPDC050738 TaxID=3154744 RepID=UPI003420ACF7